MGCFHSSIRRISNYYIFDSNDILHLTQSWNIIKAHNLQKFAQDILIKTINQNPSLRQFWRSKVQVDGNNYDYSQNESCLRTDLSWHIELRDQSIRFVSILDKLISVIHDENHLKTEIRSLNISDDFFLIEYKLLMTMKNCLLENARDYCKTFNYDFTDSLEQVWSKFLIFIVQNVKKKENEIT
ncbi:unnamed protein product [Rotaria magnacalcarata]|uniref:Uncharacterized protein n=1 Tax=Rotaria magnacalcarata TaxID=392030 RepID=A0A814YEB8_9BILA|nr:unnamed protein product [Rotaria magnacalcarata]CAF1601556.1 unnamed protein product [Rotaria magnacalcarata]CAF1913293.1 unnamed protein product [Rotaria magnacalcarata]CAF1940912.1 unnamed protein product [Rotaria magnacalcarata]CAF1963628.1 unnamed protein product [Rotaria magnacalcarata]